MKSQSWIQTIGSGCAIFLKDWKPCNKNKYFQILLLIGILSVVAVESYVLVDPITGRVLEKQSPSFQSRRFETPSPTLDIGNTFEISNSDSDLPLYQPQQRRVPAPEYYAMDGLTPIYKIFKRNPYGRWETWEIKIK